MDLHEKNRQRIALVYLIDPKWAEMVLSFVEKFPEFYPYLYLTATTRKIVEDIDFKSIKERLIYYVCHAGVRTSYGLWLWNRVRYLNAKEISRDEKITKKKKDTILSILDLDESKLKTKEDIENIKISGVGHGCKRYILSQVFDDVNTVDWSDLNFLKGLQKLYNLEKKPTPNQAKKMTSKWLETGIAGVGTMFVFGIYHYT